MAQVVHHLADADSNVHYRHLKRALTEDAPRLVRTRIRDRWAELPDARDADIGPAIDVFAAIRGRCALLYESLSDQEFARTMVMADGGEVRTIDRLLQGYAHHGLHHIAHITSLRTRRGW